MDERGLRGTFYLAPKMDNWRAWLEPWTEVAAGGHEIGNHTLSHTCSRNFSDDTEAKGLERSTLAEIEADVLEAEDRLQQVLPAPERTFAYPCYQTAVGEGLTRESYVPMIARHFTAARTIGEYGFANSPINADLHYLACQNAEHFRAAELIGLVQRAVNQGRWLIFAFHQIEGGRLGIAEYEFIGLLDFLAQQKGRVWTAPVLDVAKFALQARKAYT